MNNILFKKYLILGMIIFGVLFFAKTSLAAVLLRDNFEYEITRGSTNKVNLFQINGGWTYTKSEPLNTGANGYLYTTTSIPGYVGVFPGQNSQRVLAMESLPASEGNQTDFYLQLGNGESAAYDNYIPGNVWFQFWFYVNKYGSQNSGFSGGKFIYPCNTSYPCPGSGEYHNWLLTLKEASGPPQWQDFGFENYDIANMFMINLGTGADIQTEADYNQWKLGQQDAGNYITPNRWQLIKLHMDTSTGSGTYEAWVRPSGQDWIKVAEYINGVTPNFSWILPQAQVARGHRVFRMPTTMGSGSPSYFYRNRDTWMYLDDFVMANSESDLPVYEADTTPPSAPSGVIVS